MFIVFRKPVAPDSQVLLLAIVPSGHLKTGASSHVYFDIWAIVSNDSPWSLWMKGSPHRVLSQLKCMYFKCVSSCGKPLLHHHVFTFIRYFLCGKRTRKAQLKNYYNTLYCSIILLALPFSLKVRNIQYTYELTLSFLKTWDQVFTLFYFMFFT